MHIKKINLILKELSLTQTELANKLDVSFPTLNKWLHGKSTPRKQVLKKIEALYNSVTNADIHTHGKTIGLIEGGGTGQELCDQFKLFVSSVAQKNGVKVNFFSFFEKFGYRPHSFWSLQKDYRNKPYAELEKLIKKETFDILSYDDQLLNLPYLGIFRTAINAETLYYLRSLAQTIKVVPLEVESSKRKINILFLRDQIQGFYTNKSIRASKNELQIDVSYSQDSFNKLTSFYERIIKKLDFVPDKVIFIYKFHIVGLELQKMIDASMVGKKNIKYTIMQPDSGMHYLFHDMQKDDSIKNVAVICGNEVGDMLLEGLIHVYNIGTKETMYQSNYVLGKQEIEALQTMHGSADDIAGKNIINPTATLKAAAHALEEWLRFKGMKKKVDMAISQVIKAGLGTHDTGGKGTTTSFTEDVLTKILH